MGLDHGLTGCTATCSFRTRNGRQQVGRLARHVPMKFNRLVLFEPWLWHAAGPGFGDSVSNGRLIYLMSYNRA